jgi:hypothetical protein
LKISTTPVDEMEDAVAQDPRTGRSVFGSFFWKLQRTRESKPQVKPILADGAEVAELAEMAEVAGRRGGRAERWQGGEVAGRRERQREVADESNDA